MINIKNFFKRNIVKDKYISKNLIKPCRDWRLLIISFLIMLVVSITFDFLTYQKIVKDEMYVSVVKEELVLVELKDKELEDIVSDFEKKREYISEIKIIDLLDPSI